MDRTLIMVLFYITLLNTIEYNWKSYFMLKSQLVNITYKFISICLMCIQINNFGHVTDQKIWTGHTSPIHFCWIQQALCATWLVNKSSWSKQTTARIQLRQQYNCRSIQALLKQSILRIKAWQHNKTTTKVHEKHHMELLGRTTE